MKKIILISFAALIAVLFSACGPHMYKTQSAGKDNAAYVIVLKEAGEYENVTVVVDGQDHPFGKVYKVKAKRKAHPVIITPGKHNIKVIVNGEVMADESVFLGNQETKMFVLR